MKNIFIALQNEQWVKKEDFWDGKFSHETYTKGDSTLKMVSTEYGGILSVSGQESNKNLEDLQKEHNKINLS